ncbi:uncharacterized protein LOC131286038 [Anopheles ziemanni]|uniref:uncharacterized protein LOC131258823 n=1 Tax=Anopheles coustani TaxID=139045 RepID=UPI00265802E7|nr:uncharacterized protein LOC131258823 [Anopheles coustani]XP_058170882.1 uncharacterized protein LOC131286038 [Anopheles ziemanni]
MAFAGNIQTSRKNCASTNFPFCKSNEESTFLQGDCTEYDQNFVGCQNDAKPALRRDQLREAYEKKLRLILAKNASEQLETLHRQEEERSQLRKRMNYYMAKDNKHDPQYSLQRTDDAVTFWSYKNRRNGNHRINNAFTKHHDEKLDVQFE